MTPLLRIVNVFRFSIVKPFMCKIYIILRTKGKDAKPIVYMCDIQHSDTSVKGSQVKGSLSRILRPHLIQASTLSTSIQGSFLASCGVLQV